MIILALGSFLFSFPLRFPLFGLVSFSFELQLS